MHTQSYKILAISAVMILFIELMPSANGQNTNTPDDISPAAIKAHMTFLADDLLEGREAGTRGEALAALYISTQFEALGLLPSGDNSSFLQSFPVRQSQLDLDSVSFTVSGPEGQQRFNNGDDIVMFSSPIEASQHLEGELVFAGYGIIAPELAINDYAGLDVSDKFAVVLGGPPAFLPAAEAAHYGSTAQQRITAGRQGAKGLIVIYTPALQQRWAFDRFRNILGRTELDWLGPDGLPSVAAPNIKARVIVDGKAADALFAGTGKTVAALIDQAQTKSPKGFALESRISLTRRSLHNDALTASNVAALLPGSHPVLKDEVVVVTAHYDHLGIGEAVDGDTIYNGAGDNAMGTGAIMEIARAVAQTQPRPGRSILFLAVSAEEKGLIGSDYFAEFPTVSVNNIIANINIDGGLPFYDFSDIIGFGIEHSQLYERLQSAMTPLGISIATDPFPAQGIFTRSDQYSFARRGIPAVFLFTGFNSTDGSNPGLKHWHYMTTAHGHKPSDDLSRGWDYQIIAKFARAALALTIETASNQQRPLWYQDSHIGRLFAPDAAKATRPINQPVTH